MRWTGIRTSTKPNATRSNGVVYLEQTLWALRSTRSQQLRRSERWWWFKFRHTRASYLLDSRPGTKTSEIWL